MKDIADVGLPDDYLIEIGRVSVTWSLFESILDLSLLQLSGIGATSPRGLAIFAHMSFPMKIQLLTTMIDILRPDYPGLRDYPKVKALLTDAQQQRNIIAHQKWGTNPETGSVEISSLSARGKLKTVVRDIPLAEVKAAADVIGKASIELYKLVVLNSDNPPDII